MLIRPPNKEKSYCEIYQTSTTLMAFAKQISEGEVQRIHSYMKCRDFMGDCLHGEHFNIPVSIYGFVYDPKEYPLDKDKLRMLLKFQDPAELSNFMMNLDIPVNLEKLNGLETVEVTECNKTEVLVEASPLWQANVFLLSFYTFLLRCCCYKLSNQSNWLECIIKEHGKTNEAQYASQVKDNLIKLLPNLMKIESLELSPSGWSEKDYIGRVHNDSGFVSHLSGTKEKLMEQNSYHSLIMDTLKAA